MEFYPLPPADQISPPESFIESVKACLAHIYDLSFLQSNPLILSPEKSIAGQELRLEITHAMEALNPGADFSFLSCEARIYRLLHLHYIQKMGIEEIASILGISPRQAYRDLRTSEENLAAILWERNSKDAQTDTDVFGTSEPKLELARIDPDYHSNDLNSIIQNAVRTIKNLSVQKSISIQLDLPSEPLFVLLQETIANQVLLGLLSHAVRQAFPGSVVEVKVSDSETLSIVIRYMVSRDVDKQQMIGDLVIQLIHRLNWQLDISPIDNDFQCIKVTGSHVKTKVMIVDDNEGLVELLSRILTGQAYSVYSTSRASECLRLAQEILPDIIILDVMIPDMDGWDLLQRLKIDPKTKDIHIIICSVFKEPELAKSLGAAAFLPKPIRQSELLAIIRQFDLR